MSPKGLACAYVAYLRSLYLLHQNNHWNTKGKNFYGNHQLFERLYKSAQENADLAAEKFIGLLGHDTILLSEQSKCINKILETFKCPDNCDFDVDLVETSLKAEKLFLKFSEKVYEMMEKSGKMTHGMDDMIMSVASDREEAVYLLQQSLEGKEE